MPLTQKGRKLKKLFTEEYGKRRGKNIFYAFKNKHPRLKLEKGGLT